MEKGSLTLQCEIINVTKEYSKHIEGLLNNIYTNVHTAF